MVESNQITGLILAGGQSSRFQPAAAASGCSSPLDKGLVQWRDLPLVAHVCQYLKGKVDSVWVSANRYPEAYKPYGRVLPDDPVYGAYAGPLAGVATALRQISTPWLMTLPTDTPCLPANLLDRLSGCVGAGVMLASAVTPRGEFPLCMLVHQSLAGSLHNTLLAGQRKVRMWQQQAGGIQVRFDTTGPEFYNVNTPQDLHDLSTALASTRA